MKPGDNWLILGRKGSGKTTFGKMLLTKLAQLWPTSRIYILDIKLRDFNDWPNIVQTDSLPGRPSRNDRIQVWQPTVVKPDTVENWLFNIRHDAPAILLVDELLALQYGRRDTSEEFTKITKLGRALPIGTIAHTQELTDLPRGALSQPDHIARFRLKHPYEKRYINNLMGHELEEPSDKYGFWYSFAEKDGNPVYYSSAQKFLGLKEKRI